MKTPKTKFSIIIGTIVSLAILLSISMFISACGGMGAAPGGKTTISTQQIVSGANYLLASIDTTQPIVKAYADATTDATQKANATALVAKMDTFKASIQTFVKVAEASSNAADVNDQYATLKSTMNGLLAASAPYLIQLALPAITGS